MKRKAASPNPRRIPGAATVRACEEDVTDATAWVMPRSRRAWPSAARTAAVIIATTGLALLAAACSSPSPAASRGSPNAGGPASSPSAVSYSHCMRSHGVPSFPDPPGGGGIPKGSAQVFGVSNSEYQAAQRACQSLIPATGGSAQQQEQQCFASSDCPPAVVQRLLNVMRGFSRCMRSHGVSNFPDPTTDSQGQPFFDASAEGISDSASHSSQFIAKLNECQRETGNFPFSLG